MDATDDLVRRLNRRQRRLLIGTAGLVALLLVVVAGVLFYWSAYLLGPSGSPFTRGPYLVRVDAGSALLRYRTSDGQAVALRAVDPAGREIAGDADGRLAGLEPGVRYAWTASVDGRAAAAGSFTTPPAAADAPISFVAFADYGAGGDPEWAVARVAAAQRPDFVLAPGDNSYLVADDRVLDRNIFRPLGELLREAPLFTTLGDPHDTALDGGASIVEAFDLPADGIYTVVWGPLQIVVLGTDGAAPAALAHAREALAEGRFRHRFVVVHDPLQPGDPILPLLRDRDVEAVFVGDNHRYERRVIDGVLQFTVGTGGAPRGAFTPESADADVSIATFGLLRVDVLGDRVTYTFLDEAGGVRDRLERTGVAAG